jgi:regulator of MON1-CCZ1 complex
MPFSPSKRNLPKSPQVFAVRSTGVSVKSTNESMNINFAMDTPSAAGASSKIRSIKFSPDNRILAVQRQETSVEFIVFQGNQPNVNDMIVYKGKKIVIFGFVWLTNKEIAFISNTGVEIFTVLVDKKQLKSVKSTSLSVNWFSWCPACHFSLIASNNGQTLTPILLKAGSIVKLPCLELEAGSRPVLEKDVTLAKLYGVGAILILRQCLNKMFEVVIYKLSGQGQAPVRTDVLLLELSGRFAMNIVDDLIGVHHQASETSMLFDIGLPSESLSGIKYHKPLLPGRTIKPFQLRVPSMSLDGETINCKLYSTNWVLFQPNIVIDAKLGCLWNVQLNLSALCALMTDRVRLVDFLLQRNRGKPDLLLVLRDMVDVHYNGTMLKTIETVFDKLNALYKAHLENEMTKQMGMPLSVATVVAKKTPPRVLIDQHDMFTYVLTPIADSEQVGKILILYLDSLTKFGISAQNDISKMIINDLVTNRKLNILEQLLNQSIIHESKPLACFLLSKSNIDLRITQLAMDMLARLDATEVSNRQLCLLKERLT